MSEREAPITALKPHIHAITLGVSDLERSRSLLPRRPRPAHRGDRGHRVRRYASRARPATRRCSTSSTAWSPRCIRALSWPRTQGSPQRSGRRARATASATSSIAERTSLRRSVLALGAVGLRLDARSAPRAAVGHLLGLLQRSRRAHVGGALRARSLAARAAFLPGQALERRHLVVDLRAVVEVVLVACTARGRRTARCRCAPRCSSRTAWPVRPSRPRIRGRCWRARARGSSSRCRGSPTSWRRGSGSRGDAPRSS